MPAHVTSAERRLAVEQDLDKARLQRIGIDAATRIGFVAQQAALRAYRRGGDVGAAFRNELLKARNMMRSCMVAADLAGRARSLDVVRQSRPIAAAFGELAYKSAIDVLLRRLAMGAVELTAVEAKYDAAALRVLKGASDAVEEKLQRAILTITKKNLHVRDGVKAVGRAFEAAGISPNNSFTLEAIFRTQTAQAYSAGRWQSAQEPAIQEILWGYKYVTVGDDRVRPEHVGFDGVTLPKNDPFWRINTPPNGWCCRCTVIEVFEPRKPVRPPDEVDVDGKMVRPAADQGFRFNPGEALEVVE